MFAKVSLSLDGLIVRNCNLKYPSLISYIGEKSAKKLNITKYLYKNVYMKIHRRQILMSIKTVICFMYAFGIKCELPFHLDKRD